MSTRFLIFLFGTFLLVQCAHGNAIGNKSESIYSTEETNKTTKGNNKSSQESHEIKHKLSSKQLEDYYAGLEYFIVGLKEMANLISSTYNITTTAFRPLIANINVNENATGNVSKSELQEKLAKVKLLYDKINNNLNEDDPLDMGGFIDKLFKIFDGFNGTTTVQSTTNLSQLERDVMKAQENMKSEIVTIFTSYSERMVAAADKSWKYLAPKIQQKEKASYDLYVSVKNEPDQEKKFALFRRFAMHFDDLSEEEH